MQFDQLFLVESVNLIFEEVQGGQVKLDSVLNQIISSYFYSVGRNKESHELLLLSRLLVLVHRATVDNFDHFFDTLLLGLIYGTTRIETLPEVILSIALDVARHFYHADELFHGFLSEVKLEIVQNRLAFI